MQALAKALALFLDRPKLTAKNVVYPDPRHQKALWGCESGGLETSTPTTASTPGHTTAQPKAPFTGKKHKKVKQQQPDSAPQDRSLSRSSAWTSASGQSPSPNSGGDTSTTQKPKRKGGFRGKGGRGARGRGRGPPGSAFGGKGSGRGRGSAQGN